MIGTIAGFGSSTVFLPLALLFVDFHVALVLVAVFHIFGNIGRFAFFRYGLDWKLLLKFGAPGVIATLAGSALVPHVQQDALKLVLGLFLLLFSAFSLRFPGFHFKPTSAKTVLGGAVSGFLAGLIGTGGALRGAFLTGFNLRKEKYIATSAAIALAVDFTRVPVYLSSGFLQEQYYWHVSALLAVALAGAFAGKKLVDLVPQERFRKLVLAAIALAGLKFAYDGLAAFL